MATRTVEGTAKSDWCIHEEHSACSYPGCSCSCHVTIK